MRSKRSGKEAKCTTIPTVLDGGTLHEMIANRAYELYENRGCVEGHDCEDWLDAERRVLAELKAGPIALVHPVIERVA